MNRIKTNIFRLALVLLAPAVMLISGCKSNDYRLKGSVTDLGGKPVAGVVVSDGYSCTQTDHKGKYTLVRDSLARHIFMSVPSGYEAAGQAGYGSMPDFYRSAFPQEGDRLAKYRVDFQLIPIAKETQKFVLFAIGDPQSNKEEDAMRFRNQTMPDIKRTLESYGTDVYAVGLALGDIVGIGTPESYFTQKTTLGMAGFPILTTPGNHDKDAVDWTGDAYSAAFGPMWYSYNVGDVHIVSMDNIHEFSAKEKGAKLVTTGFSDEQLNWLRKDLSYVPKDKKVIMFYHVPERNHTSHLNHDEVLSLVAEYTRPVTMCGHTHYYQFFNNNGYGIDEYILGAACGYFWRSDVEGDGVPNGYNVFEVDGTVFSNAYFKGTDHSRDHQIRLYRGNEKFGGKRGYYDYDLGRKSIVANVFFGGMGGDWKVEVYENGTLSGEMEKMAADIPDYWAYGYHTGILSYSFVSAKSPNHHQYKYELKNPRAEVLIKATDPWGNVYTQNRFWSNDDRADIDGSFRNQQ